MPTPSPSGGPRTSGHQPAAAASTADRATGDAATTGPVRDADGCVPIGGYGMLGDGRSVALVAVDGRVKPRGTALGHTLLVLATTMPVAAALLLRTARRTYPRDVATALATPTQPHRGHP